MKRNFIMVLAVFTIFSAFTVFATETVTNTQMLDMCMGVHEYIYTNGVVPQIVYTDSSHANSVTAAEFYYMMSRWLRWYKNNGDAPNTVSIIRGTAGPASPSGTESGQIQLADILAKGESNANFIDSNSRLPNYSTVGSTQYSTKAMFWVFTRTMRWYHQNDSMPNYATVSELDPPASWTGGPTPTPGPTSTPTPGPTPTPTPTPGALRPIYIVSDWINDEAYDNARMNKLVSKLHGLGATRAYKYGWYGAFWRLVKDPNVPSNSLVVEIAGGADAGSIYEKGGSYWINSVMKGKKEFIVFFETAASISVAWLPRAHDDNYSPPSFTGLAHPDQYLLNLGIHFYQPLHLNSDEQSFNACAQAIYNAALL